MNVHTYTSGLSRLCAALVILLGMGLATVSTATAEETDGASPLELTELTVCRGVENGQAVDPSDTFAVAGENIYALVRVNNPERRDTNVFVSFVKEGRDSVRGRQLAIAPRARVRTVARTSSGYLGAGSYKVIVRDADGTVIGERTFTIQ